MTYRCQWTPFTSKPPHPPPTPHKYHPLPLKVNKDTSRGLWCKDKRRKFRFDLMFQLMTYRRDLGEGGGCHCHWIVCYRRQIVWWGLIVACGVGEVGLGGVRVGGWPFFYREFKLVLYMVPKVKNSNIVILIIVTFRNSVKTITKSTKSTSAPPPLTLQGVNTLQSVSMRRWWGGGGKFERFLKPRWQIWSRNFLLQIFQIPFSFRNLLLSLCRCHKMSIYLPYIKHTLRRYKSFKYKSFIDNLPEI